MKNKFKNLSYVFLLLGSFLYSESLETENIVINNKKIKIESNISKTSENLELENIVIDGKEIKFDDNLSQKVVTTISDKYKTLQKELEISKLKKLKMNKLFGDYYSFEFAKKVQGYDEKNNDLSKPEYHFCENKRFLDKPVQECYFFSNYKYKDVTLSRLTNVVLQFRIVFDRNDEFLFFLNRNKDYVNLETHVTYFNEEYMSLNYYFDKNKGKKIRVGEEHLKFKENFYKELLESDQNFILADSFIELKKDNEDMKNYETLEEFMNLSENYSRIIRQFINCEGKKCTVEYQFNSNNANHYLINYFYRLHGDDKVINKIYKDTIIPKSNNSEFKKNLYDF